MHIKVLPVVGMTQVGPDLNLEDDKAKVTNPIADLKWIVIQHLFRQ